MSAKKKSTSERVDMSQQPIYNRQQARKRAEVDFGPWASRLTWILKSNLIAERRALRFREDEPARTPQEE